MSHTASLRYCRFRDEDFGYLHFSKLLVLGLHEGTANETATEVNDLVDLVMLRETKEKVSLKIPFHTFLVLLSLYYRETIIWIMSGPKWEQIIWLH